MNFQIILYVIVYYKLHSRFRYKPRLSIKYIAFVYMLLFIYFYLIITKEILNLIYMLLINFFFVENKIDAAFLTFDKFCKSSYLCIYSI